MCTPGSAPIEVTSGALVAVAVYAYSWLNHGQCSGSAPGSTPGSSPESRCTPTELARQLAGVAAHAAMWLGVVAICMLLLDEFVLRVAAPGTHTAGACLRSAVAWATLPSAAPAVLNALAALMIYAALAMRCAQAAGGAQARAAAARSAWAFSIVVLTCVFVALAVGWR